MAKRKISDTAYHVSVGFPETNGQVGFTPVMASSAQEAIEKIKKSQYGDMSKARLSELTFSAIKEK